MSTMALMDDIDKENWQVSVKEEQGKVSANCYTPARLPLQEVNGCRPVHTLQKCPQYSQITPVTTPDTRTPKRQANAQKFQLGKDHGIPLNSLIYKKLNDILLESEKDYKEQLQEKDKYIASLRQRLGSDITESQSPEVQESRVNVDLSEYVEGVIEKAKQELQVELKRPSDISHISTRRFFPSIGTPPSVSLKRHKRWVHGSAGSDSDIAENTDQSSVFKMPSLLFHNDSARPEMSPDRESHESIFTVGPECEEDEIQSIDMCASGECKQAKPVGTGQVKPGLTRSVTQCFDMTDGLIQSLSVDTQTDEIEFTGMTDMPQQSRNYSNAKRTPCLAISPVHVIDVATGEVDTVSADIKTVITPPTPVKVDLETSQSHQKVTPPRMVHAETTMTPIDLVDCVIGTDDHVSYEDSATCYSPVPCHNAQTMMTPYKYADASQATTPLQTTSMGTLMSPVHVTSCETMVTPVKYTDNGQCPSPIACNDTSVGTTPVRTHSVDTMMTPVRFMDCAQSPISVDSEHVCCGTTPIKMLSVDTMVTPVHHSHAAAQTSSPVRTKDASTATSPFCHNMPRPSELNFADFNPRNLASQLETAVISNTILRSELESLQNRLSLSRKHEEEARSHLGNVVNQNVLQEQVSELMAQQSEALDQLSHHQNLLSQQEATISKLEADKKHLTEENSNLQHDLVSAYKQKKQEIITLKEKFAARNYEPHFHRAQEHIRKLETELQEYTGLSQILCESQLKQSEAAAITAKVAEQLKLQNKRHRDQWLHWQQQHTVWVTEIDTNRQALEAANVAKDRLEQEMASLTNKLREAEAAGKQASDKCSQLQGALEQATFFSERLEAATEELSCVQSHLEHKELELNKEKQKTEMLTEENTLQSKKLQEVQNNLQKLTREMETTKASLDSQTNYANKLISEKKGVNIILEGQRRLIKSLEEQIKSFKQKQKDLEVKDQKIQNETASYNKALHDLNQGKAALMESLQEETAAHNATKLELSRVNALAKAHEDEAHALKQELDQLREILEELQMELDETKTHAHLMLLRQGNQINTSMISTMKFAERLRALEEQLESRVVAWTEQINQTESCSTKDETGRSSPPLQSFLASVLSALKDRREKSQSVSSPLVSSTTEEQGNKTEEMDDGEMPSAFVKVQRGASVSSDMDNTTESSPPSGETSQLSENGEMSLNDQIDTLSNIFTGIVENFKLLDQAVTTTITKLQKDIESLRQKQMQDHHAHRKATSLQEEHLSLVQRQLEDSQGSEKHLQNELTTAHESIISLRQQIQSGQANLEDSLGKLDKMTVNEIEFKKLHQEVGHLTDLLKEKSNECDTIKETMDSWITKLSLQDDGAQLPVARALQEITSLKREVSRLRGKLLQIMEEKDTIVRRAQKYNTNWKKAEKEVVTLDEIIEQLREVLSVHQEEVENWSEGKYLIELGVFDVATKSKSAT